MFRPEAADRRTTDRHEVEVEIDIDSDSNFYTGLTQDVSTGGLFVATHRIRRVGERIHVKFRLPGHDQPIEAHTEVRWLRENSSLRRADGAHGMGLRFIELSAEARSAIQAFFKKRESLFYDDE